MSAEQELNVTEVCERLQETRGRILYWLTQGHFAGAYRARTGGATPWRIPLSSVEGFVKPTPAMRKKAGYARNAFTLTADEREQVRQKYIQYAQACRRLGVEPESTLDDMIAEFEGMPPRARAEELNPQPAEDLRELHTARYQAYETPRRDWVL